MTNGEVYDIAEMSIDGEDYRLAREQIAQRVLGADARRWREDRVKVVTKRTLRSNVRQGDAPDEWLITYDDWSQGATGVNAPRLGALYIGDNIDTTHEGEVRSVQTIDNWNTTSGTSDPAIVIEFNGASFICVGQKVYIASGVAGPSGDKDFGSGYTIVDATVFNNELVVGFGGSTKKIQTRNTSGTWTEATDATYINYFGGVEDRLWRGTATNEVSNIGPTDNPLTLANWSSGITVGDDDVAITDLNGQGERLWVSKEDGLYPGDAAAIFPNVLPGMKAIRHSENGKQTLILGASIFYPHKGGGGGLTLYENGVAQEIGLNKFLTEILPEDSISQPSTVVTAMTSDGSSVWVATEPSFYPRADITGALKTVDNESSYTDSTSAVTDNDFDTYALWDDLDTAANGDYLYFGYSAKSYGFFLNMADVNTNTSVLSAEYWNGSAWASATIYDGTAVNDKTLAQSGAITLYALPGSWATSTIEGIAAFWLRFSVSATLSASVQAFEIRAITQSHFVNIYRLKRISGAALPYIWQPVFRKDVSRSVTAMGISSPASFHYEVGATLLFASQRVTEVAPLPTSDSSYGHNGLEGGAIYMPYDDAGMPEMNKQWLDITGKGRRIDDNHTIDLFHRVDGASSWTTDASNINSTPTTTTLNSITGYALQTEVDLDVASGQDLPTILTELEIRFRELPTWKNQYTVLLEIADGQARSKGGMLHDMDVQLSNLEGDQGAGTVTVTDPIGRSKSMTVDRLEVLEYLQSGMDTPTLLVQCTMTEV